MSEEENTSKTLEITEEQFKRMSVKEQNLIIFRNTQASRVDAANALKSATNSKLIAGAAMSLTIILLGVVLTHLSQVHP